MRNLDRAVRGALLESGFPFPEDAGGLCVASPQACLDLCPVLRSEDPRATIQYALGERLCPDDPLFRTARTMRRVVVGVLQEIPKISNPYPNVDAVSGSLLNAVGLTDPDYYTVLFGMARMSGISAQIVDERVRARNGRGVPIYRPRYIAVDQDR